LCPRTQRDKAFKGNPLVNQNVSAVVIYFWNAGNLPIHPTEILEKDHSIHCVFTDDIQILKVDITTNY
jgi:hypothetical protein